MNRGSAASRWSGVAMKALSSSGVKAMHSRNALRTIAVIRVCVCRVMAKSSGLGQCRATYLQEKPQTGFCSKDADVCTGPSRRTATRRLPDTERCAMRNAADVIQQWHLSGVSASTRVLNERVRLSAHTVDPWLVRNAPQRLFDRSVALAREVFAELGVELSHLRFRSSPAPTDLAGVVMPA
jgi:hypothetical protein